VTSKRTLIFAHVMEGKTKLEVNTDFTESEISAEYCNIPISSRLFIRGSLENMVLCLTTTSLVSKRKVHSCTDTEALYRPYGPQGD